jgi:phosphatidylserine/phosphatidylglycerophosphate/cardiolipin synthase-like enzyme
VSSLHKDPAWFRQASVLSLVGLISIIILATAEVATAQLPVNPSCSAQGQECLCDNAFEDCRAPLLTLINNETVGIDVSMWFMTDYRYKDAIIAKKKQGVPVRIIIDLQADTNYPANAPIRAAFVNAGIPIRDCTSSLGINHWKAMIFVGQKKLQFSAANFAAGSFSPEPATSPYVNYVDEAIYFTHDESIVYSFMKKFDDHWTDTTAFTNYANISGTPTRNYPDLATYTLNPDLNFVPYQDFENRLRTQVNLENQKIDAVMFRITSAKIPDALIARKAAGVPVRLITDERQYRNPTYFWDSYNADRMFMAGIDIKFKDKTLTDQDMHQKSIVLYSRGLATSSQGGPGPMVEFGSSNWTSKSSNGQREHNYFSRKQWMIDWFIEQFERKWNNLRVDGTPIGETVFKPFTPGFPEAPVYSSPANDALAQSTTPTLKWEGGWWAHKYDIYVSTSPTPTSAPIYSLLDYAPGSATAGVKSTKESITVPVDAGLQPGTTYYWQVRGKTMANKTKLGVVWRFTTAGGVPPPPAPTGLTASPVSSSRIDLAWTDVTGEEGYKIERKLTSVSTWTQIAQLGADVVSYADSSGLSPGTGYNYRVRAFTSGGNSGYSNTATATTPTPTLSDGDVVLYAKNAAITGSKWAAVADATAAGGARISSANLGGATVTTPVAHPADYFELQFTATAGTPYRLWMRGKATSNNGYNDSVWVQFAGAVNGNGTPINIGTTNAEWVNLQDCSGATLNGWGWQDNGYAASPCGFLGPVITFSTSGVQTIRVQVREDGASFDQIVLSPDTYLNVSPGATKTDTVILPEQTSPPGGAPPPPPAPDEADVVLYASKADVTGDAWQVVADSTAAGGARISNANLGAATVTTPVADPADYFELQFTASGDIPYRLWMRGKAVSNNGYNDSVWVQFSDAENSTGVPIDIGTTQAEWVNLQDCSGATLSGWGWQDNGYASTPCGFAGPVIRFATSGVQTLRVQVREDGASFDQIVLSPNTYLNAAPGATKADTVILAEQGAS